jgi:hypothetical protein
MFVHDEAGTAPVIEERQAMGSCIVIDAALRQRGDLSLAKERLHQVFVDAESFGDDFCVDDDGVIFDLNFEHLSISGGKLNLR